MRKVRLMLFLLVITLFAASIPGTPLSTAYRHSTVSADPEGDTDPQEGGEGGLGRDARCQGTWIWFFGWHCFMP
jgi:hypothetical protein